ncbi:MAG: hypothetical protein PHV33_05400 [Elusimicrobiales bacterium]|nr:hypothetical protein [Elusimicrobiales bacterium]
MAIDKFFVKHFILELRYKPLRTDKSTDNLSNTAVVEKFYSKFEKFTLNPARLIDEETCREYVFEPLRHWYGKENAYNFMGGIPELKEILDFAYSQSNFKEIGRVGLRYYVIAQESEPKKAEFYKNLLYKYLPIAPDFSKKEPPVSEAGLYSHVSVPDNKWFLRFGSFVSTKDVAARYHKFKSAEQQIPGLMYDLDFYRVDLPAKDFKIEEHITETYDMAVNFIKRHVNYLETGKWQ